MAFQASSTLRGRPALRQFTRRRMAQISVAFVLAVRRRVCVVVISLLCARPDQSVKLVSKIPTEVAMKLTSLRST